MNRYYNAVAALFVVAVFIVPAATAVMASDSEGNEFVSYYDQLDINGKVIYDTINSADIYTDVLIIDLPIVLTARSDMVSDAETLIEDVIKTIIDDVLDAIKLSSPLAYWAWGPSVLNYQSDIKVSNNIATVTSLTFEINLSNYTSDDQPDGPAVIQRMLDEINATLDGFTTESTTARDIVLDINNFLIDLVTYDPNGGSGIESMNVHDAYGALGDPRHYAVCDGYSKAFLLLCQKYDIDCVVVFGTALPSLINHAWNYVKLDNGVWYAIDVTWNDGSDNAYFLMGGENFFKTHQQGVYLTAGLIPYPFNSPYISKTDFEPTNVEGYEKYAWIFAVMIVAILSVVLFRHAQVK